MPPTPTDPWPIPRFNMHIEDLDHEGVEVFFAAVNPKHALRESVLASFKQLYTTENVPTNVKTITLILTSMDGVAYTWGTAAHKTITFSLDYINKISAERAKEEIMGVLVHEVVHCYQYNALETCPGGLIEGIADFVRLHEELQPPHWRKAPGEKWDAGYEKTAYFLDWLEEQYGDGTIRKLNAALKDSKYSNKIFKRLVGRSLSKLWKMYCASFESEKPPPDSPGVLHVRGAFDRMVALFTFRCRP